MNLFELLSLNLPDMKPKECKIHLAVCNGYDNPIDLYLSGDFEKWQSWQTKKNFERKYIVSLVQLPGNYKWLFAGGYISEGREYIEKDYKYKTKEIKELSELSGRLIVLFNRSGRQYI